MSHALGTLILALNASSSLALLQQSLCGFGKNFIAEYSLCVTTIRFPLLSFCAHLYLTRLLDTAPALSNHE